jgi:hypothetical protein
MKKYQSFIAGFIIGAVLFSGVAVAANEVISRVQLNYYFNGIKQSPPADQQGFIVNGSTYVPLRWLTESLGQPVTWDGATNSIYIGAVIVDLTKVTPITTYNIEKKSPIIDRIEYTDALWFRDTAWAKWDLQGKYTKLTITAGYDQTLIGAERGGALSVMADGKSIGKTTNLTAQDKTKEFTFDISGVNQLEILTGDGFSSSLLLKAVVE